MPVLSRRAETEGAQREKMPASGSGSYSPQTMGGGLWQDGRLLESSRSKIFSTCANPQCKSGWLRLWRSRSGPVFEGGWCCSAECTAVRIAAAFWRESERLSLAEEPHRHRIPLGLAMLEQGWITSSQLRHALEAQRAAGCGRIGQWLVRQGVSEHLVTRALGLQWSCPVLEVEPHILESLTPLLPRLFVDAFGVLPLRVAAGRILYLGFGDRLDPVLALAVERMTGLRVESGLVPESVFHPAHTRMLKAQYQQLELIEASSENALAQTIARRVERACPVESRLVRVHNCLWLRMWTRPQRGSIPEPGMVQDVVCSLRVN
jgi:hypothetical protein